MMMPDWKILLPTILACGASVAAAAPEAYKVPQSAAPLTVDGVLEEPFWNSVPAQRLSPAEAGVPPELGGDVRVALRGNQLVLAARCPEPGGKVLARSIGRNPVWEKDAAGSPEVEDRVEYRVAYTTAGGGERSVTIAVNPWGALRVEQDGNAVPAAEVLAAAQVTSRGWTLEVAAPLSLLNLNAGARGMTLRASRIRSRRPLAPEFRWQWQATLDVPALPADAGALPPPGFRPAALGNSQPALEVGRTPRVPPIVPEWDDPAWKDVPAFVLGRNEPYPRAPRYPTEVKWMHDGTTLALLVRVVEPEPVVARNGGRDSAVTQDDHVAIYLATSGSAFLQIAVNSVGALRDARGIGPHSASPQAGWNAPIQAQTNIRYGAWTARINLPLLECAAALGETAIPSRWRILLSRYRAARGGEDAETSALPATGSATFFGPARYRAVVLRDLPPSQVLLPEMPYEASPQQGLAGEIATLDSRVWSPLDRRYRSVRSMLQNNGRKRAERAILEEHRAFDAIQTRADWERFRDLRLKALREAAGAYPAAERPPLDVRVTGVNAGDGYRRENLVYQSRPGLYVSANLYLPAKPSPSMPGIVIQHSHHYPKTQGELQDMGMLWARTGCAVLVIERLGFGERVETTPWYRQSYASRRTFSKQLALAGESHSGWMAWDLIRAVDLLYERRDIDRDRIIVIGSVAGGGEPAAVAAALDARISAVIPFNYDEGHIKVDEDLFGQISSGFTSWFIAASIAPRRFIRAFEFGWEGAEEPDFPDLWVSGWLRSQKIWGFYGALENLASSQAYGLIRLSMERVSHCWSVGPRQRKEIYPILQRWFGIPLPSQQDLSILPDSDLSTNTDPEASRIQEAQRRRPDAELLSIPPAVSAQLRRKPLHRIAWETASRSLESARAARQSLSDAERRRKLQQDVAKALGDIEPNPSPRSETTWRRSLSAATVEAVELQVEDGIAVPLLLIRPRDAARAPVVIAVAQEGKERFLANRPSSIEALIRAGVAVCLPDVRGAGETSPDADRSDDGAQQGIAAREFALGATLVGARLKDLRTVLAYLSGRSDIDARRIALWGDAFTPPNPRDLILDELQWEAGPQIQHRAEPLGTTLVLLAALYDDNIRAVAAQRGISGYLSILDNAFTYVPMDAIVPGILKAGDIADIAAALAPRPLLLEGLVTGRNILLSPGELSQALNLVAESYQRSGAADRFTRRADPADPAAWLAASLKAQR